MENFIMAIKEITSIQYPSPRTITFDGIAEKYEQVHIVLDDLEIVIGSTMADLTGKFSVDGTLPDNLEPGVYYLNLTDVPGDDEGGEFFPMVAYFT